MRRLALRWWCHNDRHHHASIMGEEGLKEILLLRVYPSRFSGIPNRGTPPDHNGVLTSEGTPREGSTPRPPVPNLVHTSRPGRGCYILPVHGAFENENKKVLVLYDFFSHAPAHYSGVRTF